MKAIGEHENIVTKFKLTSAKRQKKLNQRVLLTQPVSTKFGHNDSHARSVTSSDTNNQQLIVDWFFFVVKLLDTLNSVRFSMSDHVSLGFVRLVVCKLAYEELSDCDFRKMGSKVNRSTWLRYSRRLDLISLDKSMYVNIITLDIISAYNNFTY